MSDEIKIERTGNGFSIASSEFKITYPDGFVGKVWSPPWHDWDEAEEEKHSLKYAKYLRENQLHKSKESVKWRCQEKCCANGGS